MIPKIPKGFEDEITVLMPGDVLEFRGPMCENTLTLIVLNRCYVTQDLLREHKEPVRCLVLYDDLFIAEEGSVELVYVKNLVRGYDLAYDAVKPILIARGFQ